MAERARGAAPELDRLFRAFRSGDETSLAELVTRTTPWLNAVARRAGARGAEIEEVVQDAWIEASSPMAIPPRSVPLLVWLASIVQHRLLHLRRHQGRRSRLHLVDAAAVDRAVAPSGRTDVVAQARGREVVNLVHQALEGLEPTYRDVLYLNLFEGLSPSAVSQQLGIGRVVVRVRLLRGLRKLRSRLPDALALLLLATLTRNGRSQAPLWLGVGVAATVAIGASLALAEGGPQLGPAVTSATAATPLGASPAAIAIAGEPGRLSPDAAATAGDVPMLRIAVTDERGVSLPGVGVALVPAQGGDPRATTRRAATGPDGTVALPAAKGGVFELQTDRGTVRRFTATGHSMALDVRVTGGRELHGSVVDSAGAPVAGAAIWLATDDDPLAGTEVAMTGSAGTYALRGVPASVWIAARAPGLAAIAARRAVTPECTLQLTQPGGSIAGRVIDRTGAPVADALVVIGAGGEGVSARLGPDFVPEMPPPQTVRTDARGAFVASGVPMGTTPVVVRAVDHAPSCRQIVVAAGVTDAVFTLEPGVHLRGEVVDRSTGAPLAALVSCRSDDSFATGTAQCGADGRFEFASLPPGQLGLVAVTGDGASVDLALECAPGDRFVRIELEPRQWRDASIHTATGAVLAGWEVAAPRSAQMVPGTDTVPAVADEGGRLRIAVDAGAGWRHLLVRPPGSVPWLSAAGLTTSRTDGGWEVIVPDTAVPAARLAVVARDAGGVPAAGARVWLRAGGGPLLEVGVLDARGEIDIGPLPAGSYEVFTATVSPAMPPFDLPAVTLRAGEKRRFEYTSRHTARVEYAFTFADGSRPRAPRVQLMASIPGVARATARSCTGHFTTLPGCGVLTADGSDFVPVGDAQFEALPDSVVKVERIVRRAARRMLSLADLPEVGRGSSLKGRFCDVRTGEVLGCFEVPTKEAMLRPLHAVLPEGLFRLEAVSPDGVRLRAEFRCDGLEPEYSARRLIFAIDR